MENKVINSLIFDQKSLMYYQVYSNDDPSVTFNLFFLGERFGAPWPTCTCYYLSFYFRCHQNDLENVLPFVLIGLFYVLTGPSVYSATLHFRLFAGARLLHTIVYLNAIRQPSRAICFTVNFGVNISMLVAILQVANY